MFIKYSPHPLSLSPSFNHPPEKGIIFTVQVHRVVQHRAGFQRPASLWLAPAAQMWLGRLLLHGIQQKCCPRPRHLFSRECWYNLPPFDRIREGNAAIHQSHLLPWVGFEESVQLNGLMEVVRAEQSQTVDWHQPEQAAAGQKGGGQRHSNTGDGWHRYFWN